MEPHPQTTTTPMQTSVNGRECGTSLAQRAALRVRVVVACCTLMFGILACDEVPQRPDTEKRDPAIDDSFVGNYQAKSGNTAIGMNITRDRFTALLTITGAGQAAPRRADGRVYPMRRAGAHGNEEILIVSGTVAASGSTVTATIVEVTRNREALMGDELARYTSCSITATIGAEFAREAVTAILACLHVPTDEGVSSIEREPRETSIVGTWDIDLSGPLGQFVDLVTQSIEVSSTDLSISSHITLCPIEDLTKGQAGPSGNSGPPGQPGQPGPDVPPPPPPPSQLSFEYFGGLATSSFARAARELSQNAGQELTHPGSAEELYRRRR